MTGLFTGPGSSASSSAHPRHCVIVEAPSSAAPLLPVRCCADSSAEPQSVLAGTAVLAGPQSSLRVKLSGGCDALRVQVESTAMPDQVAVFVAPAEANARPPDSPLLPSYEGRVKIGRQDDTLEVSRLTPNTAYSVWSAVHGTTGWSAWSSPRGASTTRPTEVPHAPQAPDVVSATSCDEILLRLPPAQANVGCASYESLELEMRVPGLSWKPAAPKKLTDRLVSVSHLNPLEAVEFRCVARSSAGRALGESTGPLPGTGLVSGDGLLQPPTVSATSSQSMQIDWSAMTPLGCGGKLTWQVLYRRTDAAGDSWQVLEKSHPHTVFRTLISCLEGCSFKVLPNLVGWTQASAASLPVSTPEMQPVPPPPAVRLKLRLKPEAHELEPSTPTLLLALEDELREALAATSPQQVSAVELVDGEEFTDAVVDLLPAPAPGPTDRSPALLAQDLLSQVASPGTCRPALTLAPRTQRPHY